MLLIASNGKLLSGLWVTEIPDMSAFKISLSQIDNLIFGKDALRYETHKQNSQHLLLLFLKIKSQCNKSMRQMK